MLGGVDERQPEPGSSPRSISEEFVPLPGISRERERERESGRQVAGSGAKGIGSSGSVALRVRLLAKRDLRALSFRSIKLGV